MKRFLRAVLTLCGLCLLYGCGGGGSGSSTPPPIVATHFSVVPAQTNTTAGTAFNVTVTALDASNNMVSNYAGTVQVTSSDPQAILSPASSTLTSGMGTFSATLKTAGPQTITATDTVTHSISGTSSSINISPGAATSLSVSAPAAAAGTSFSFTVTALDAWNNVATSYSGTVHFTSTDVQAVLPANSTLPSGTAIFSATLNTDGGQTITATDTVTASIAGASKSIKITAASAVNPVPFINQPLSPDAAAPGGAAFSLAVNGTGFVSGSVVEWNGSARATNFISNSTLTAYILASDISAPNTASVTVVTPGPGGGTSNLVFFPVTLPASLAWSGSAFAAGSSPVSAVTADFNGDGKLDLAVANGAGNNVSVFLGNGDGTFQASVNYDAGSNPWSGMVVGDFRDDGKLDLVVANYGSNNVSVLLGNGDASFQAAVNYDTGINPTWVAIGDFNRDGKLDLAVSDQNCTNGGPPCGTGTVSILLGNGDGTFQPRVDYPTPQGAEGPNGVAVGDFNGDGILDLALATGSGGAGTQVSVLLGNGDGTFRSGVNYTAGLNPAAIATADFNKDGKLDLAVVNNIGSVSILLGNGDGTFQTHLDYGTGSFPWGTLGIADFNGEGNLDLAVANIGSNTVSIFLGNGDGTFQPQVQIGTGVHPHGAVVGDFNQDGGLELAVPNYNDNTVSVLVQTTAELSPTSLGFGSVAIGTTSPAQATTLTNVGTTTLNITNIAITGTNAGDFAQTYTCESSLGAGASCSISDSPSVSVPRLQAEQELVALAVRPKCAGQLG
ncbi:MAG TPA: FG-GAP-like repeat-containing protein [Terriglobales bacterium]|nr:FG-GAP-like repeat-containing protein [Terriglobales bacterium]